MPKQKLSPQNRQYIEQRGRSYHNSELAKRFSNVSPSHIKQLQAGVGKTPSVRSEAQRANGMKGAEARWHPKEDAQTRQRKYPTLSIDKQRHNFQRWKDSSIYAHWKEWIDSLQEGESMTIITRSNIESEIVRAYIRGRNDEKEAISGYAVCGKFEPKYKRVTIFTIPAASAKKEDSVPFKSFVVANLQAGTCKTVSFSDPNEWKCLSVAISRFNGRHSREKGYRIGAEYAKPAKRSATIFTISIDNENIEHT